jgi:hypothetical protein
MQSQPRSKFRVGTNQILFAAITLIFLSLLIFLRLLTLTSSANDSVKVIPNGLLSSGEKGIHVGSNESKNSYHFLISSDCTSYQRWEVLVQLHSAQQIRQCGRYTWIVSGCLEDEHAEMGKGKGGANSDKLTHSLLLEEVMKHFPVTISNHTVAKDAIGGNDDCHTIHPHVHFTPDFTDMSYYGGPFADGKLKRSFVGRNGKVQRGNFGNTYPFNNKPNGLHHWVKDFLQSDDRRDESVVLIDPDFLFLSRFEVKELVLPGKPAAAKYGLGAQVRSSKHIFYFCINVNARC